MLVHIWNKTERRTLRIYCVIWVASSIMFWMWWFQKRHVGTIVGFTLITGIFFWTYALQAYCFFFLLKMKKLSKTYPLPEKKRVAMIATKAPSEPFEILQKTLLAMLSQEYPHDTWVADENPTPEALTWYKKHGVKVSCRKDVPEYHNERWPRRRRCKEGNLAFFYDQYGYDNYDFVSQLDVDHTPGKNYLENMLRPFSDPKMGYVCAASICTNNAHQSWAARARSDAESVFHGPIQAGSNDKWVPLCIGSHYAVRTAALEEIGGIGPELAEDYSTTLMMTAHGWKGTWSYEAEAFGDGPQSFTDVIIQDYQWSRSLMTLFLSFFSKYWHKLSWRHKIGFTLTQLWYPVTALIWFITICIPIVALVFDIVPLHVDFIPFVQYAITPYLISFLAFIYVRRKGHLRPREVNMFSWENALFELARWPWVALACLDAIVSHITNTTRQFRVTPKNKTGEEIIPLKIILPHIAVITVSCVTLFTWNYNDDLIGYYWFTVLQTAAYTLLIISVLILNNLENAKTSIAKARAYSIKYLTRYSLRVFLLCTPLFLIVYTSLFNQYTHAARPTPLPQHHEVKPSGSLLKNEIYYTVREQDDLWSISKQFYNSGEYWIHIMDANKDRVLIRPHQAPIIHPGTILRIPQ